MEQSDNSSQTVPTRKYRYESTAVLTPANILTLFRLFASIPFLIWMYKDDSGWLIWSAFFILCMSDYVDGIIARRAGPTTSGAFLDPLADKVLAIGGFFVLGLSGYYAWLPIILMAIREVSVSGARSILSRYKISLPARKLGKAKTFVQLLAVGFPLFPLVADYHAFHNGFLWFACALSLISGVDLFIHAQKEVQEKNIHLGDPFPSKISDQK